jgi:hypothetical protein
MIQYEKPFVLVVDEGESRRQRFDAVVVRRCFKAMIPFARDAEPILCVVDMGYSSAVGRRRARMRFHRLNLSFRSHMAVFQPGNQR